MIYRFIGIKLWMGQKWIAKQEGGNAFIISIFKIINNGRFRTLSMVIYMYCIYPRKTNKLGCGKPRQPYFVWYFRVLFSDGFHILSLLQFFTPVFSISAVCSCVIHSCIFENAGVENAGAIYSCIFHPGICSRIFSAPVTDSNMA